MMLRDAVVLVWFGFPSPAEMHWDHSSAPVLGSEGVATASRRGLSSGSGKEGGLRAAAQHSTPSLGREGLDTGTSDLDPIDGTSSLLGPQEGLSKTLSLHAAIWRKGCWLCRLSPSWSQRTMFMKAILWVSARPRGTFLF